MVSSEEWRFQKHTVIATLFAVVSGYADVVSLVRYQVFASILTGNVIWLGRVSVDPRSDDQHTGGSFAWRFMFLWRFIRFLEEKLLLEVLYRLRVNSMICRSFTEVGTMLPFVPHLPWVLSCIGSVSCAGPTGVVALHRYHWLCWCWWRRWHTLWPKVTWFVFVEEWSEDVRQGVESHCNQNCVVKHEIV